MSVRTGKSPSVLLDTFGVTALDWLVLQGREARSYLVRTIPTLFQRRDTSWPWRCTPVFANRLARCMRTVEGRISRSVQQSSTDFPFMSRLARRASQEVNPKSSRKPSSVSCSGNSGSHTKTRTEGDVKSDEEALFLRERTRSVKGLLPEGRRMARITSLASDVSGCAACDACCMMRGRDGLDHLLTGWRMPWSVTSRPSRDSRICSAVWLAKSTRRAPLVTATPMFSISRASSPAARMLEVSLIKLGRTVDRGRGVCRYL